MRVLVIVGECIQVNSSANLCHLAYIRGLLEAGHEVTLISESGEDHDIDNMMSVPERIRSFTYSGTTLYEKISKLKKGNKQLHQAHDMPQKEKQKGDFSKKKGNKKKTIDTIKLLFLSLYGPYGIYAKFISTAFRFQDNKPYDVLISLSSPASSHRLAYKLLSAGHVKSNHWIQVWEDPWSGDVFCLKNKRRIFDEEKRLLSLADRICYVSPMTLAYQKKLFPESSGKMFWVPLPSYYSIEETYLDNIPITNNLFGYFGDYRKDARNLEPFYNAADKSGIEVNICGYSDIRFKSTNKIHVFPRLSLSELKPIEDKTDILVFLSNRVGGQIPGKVYQYASTKKTILFILDGTEYEIKMLRSFFEPYQRFVFCNNKEEEIINAIGIICSRKYSDIQNRPLREFNPKTIVTRIIEEGTK